jgi:predicted HTH transcriptional regulator
MFIKNLILEGEGQRLDFKFNISSAAKIAKTLVAFANTDGGRLLIGVKDNGNIVGVESDEEIFMIEMAAESYCKPPVTVEMSTIEVDGKVVLEVVVPASMERPHYAKDESGKWLVYIRKDDENLLASKILVEVYKRHKKKQQTFIRYEEPEKMLLNYLKDNESITFGEFVRLAKIPPRIAERVLVNLVSIGIIDVVMGGNGTYFSLSKRPVQL